MTPTTTPTKGHVFLDAALELVWPTRCSGCERSGVLLCDECRALLKQIMSAHACPRCGAPFGGLVCTECYSGEGREQHQFDAAVCALELDELSGRVIVLYKDSYERRLSGLLASYLLSALPAPWLIWADVLTWVPVDRKALRRRGFDHMELIARELSERTGLPLRRLLDKQPCRDQRGLNRSERIENHRESFSLHQATHTPPSKTHAPQPSTPACSSASHLLPSTPHFSPPSTPTLPSTTHSSRAAAPLLPLAAHSLPPHILLLDDVLTTGSTLDAASMRLKEGGAVEVRVATVARAW
ncbi:MAG: double zinc ribbon domain-containing protein [Coriobacteriales bacterium]|nr:double zinc ribbon domain-containing protein [Coriobacteriales bacterium]